MEEAEEAKKSPESSPTRSPVKSERRETIINEMEANKGGRKTFKPGDLFGDLTLITQKKWRHSNVYALEESSVLMFNNSYINKIIKVLCVRIENRN